MIDSTTNCNKAEPNVGVHTTVEDVLCKPKRGILAKFQKKKSHD